MPNNNSLLESDSDLLYINENRYEGISPVHVDNVNDTISIDDNSITADKMKSGETLQVNITGNANTANTASDYASGGGIANALNGKLNTNGNSSDTTSTFTKASGDTSSMTSGKLSSIFTSISNFFGTLKALAFKDKASYEDLSSGVQYYLDKADTAAQPNGSYANMTVGNALATSSFKYETIGTTAVDLNDLLYPNECHAYVWKYVDRNNVANKPSNDGCVVISYGYYNSNYGIQIAMDGNNYEKPLFIRFKKNKQWGDWIPFRDASWINSGTFDAARIPTSLPNVTVNASHIVSPFIIDKGIHTNKVWAKVATANVTNWNGYAITLSAGFSGYNNANAYAGEIVLGYQVGNNGVYANSKLYIYRRDFYSTDIDARLIRNGNVLELWVKDNIIDTGLYLIPIYSKDFTVNYDDSNDRTKQLTDEDFTTYIADKTYYSPVIRTLSYIENITSDSNKTTGVYVDSRGKINTLPTSTAYFHDVNGYKRLVKIVPSLTYVQDRIIKFSAIQTKSNSIPKTYEGVIDIRYTSPFLWHYSRTTKFGSYNGDIVLWYNNTTNETYLVAKCENLYSGFKIRIEECTDLNCVDKTSDLIEFYNDAELETSIPSGFNEMVGV